MPKKSKGRKRRAACMDCGMPYGGKDWLDTHVPRSQWLEINPDEGGILCANCIVRRARKRIPRVTVMHAIFEISPVRGRLRR